MGVDTATNAHSSLSQKVFSDRKRWPGDGRLKATELEVIKSLVQDVTGDPGEPSLEVDNTSALPNVSLLYSFIYLNLQ